LGCSIEHFDLWARKRDALSAIQIVRSAKIDASDAKPWHFKEASYNFMVRFCLAPPILWSVAWR
jgi:hypothetical protein